MVNIKKSGKVRVVFDAGSTYNSASLNNLLNNLVGVPTRFLHGTLCCHGDTEQMFHQIW